MKKFVAISVLLGYLLLVPACFLAENFLNTNMAMTGMTQDHCMMGMECNTEGNNMPISPLGSVSNHLSMYISMTGFIKEIIVLLTVTLFVTFISLFGGLRDQSNEIRFHSTLQLYFKRWKNQRLSSLRDFYLWQRYKTTSPPSYALAY